MEENFLGWINVDGAHDDTRAYELYKTILKETAEEQINLGNSIDFWENVIETVNNVKQDFDHDFDNF